MYDINEGRIHMLSVSPDGTLKEITSALAAVPMLEAMADAIGSHTFRLVVLPRDVEMWLDIQGFSGQQLSPNLYAAAVLATLAPAAPSRMVFGTAVFAAGQNHGALALDDHVHDLVTGLVLALGGRVVPIMRPVRMNGGRAWAWEHTSTRFLAVARDGSPVVQLKFRTDAADSVWTVSAERDLAGRSAEAVAQEMFHDTTGGVA